MKRGLPLPVRVLLSLFPQDFRAAHEAGLIEHYLLRGQGLGRLAAAWHWSKAVADLCVTLVGVWVDRWTSHGAHGPAARESGRSAGLAGLAWDLRHAARALRRSPRFTSIAVMTIAIGIGANAAIFSVVNGVLLRPPPYEEPSELVRVWSRFLPESGFDFPYFGVDPTEYLDLQASSRALESVAAYYPDGVTISGEGARAEQLRALLTTRNLFDVLGAQPAMGRGIAPEEDAPDGARVVVVSHDLWSTRFAADSAILGTTVSLNRRPHEIIGVLPAGVGFPDTDVDLYLPLRLGPNPSNRMAHYLEGVGRLAEGVSFEAAEADMIRLMATWASEYPEIHTGHFLFIENLRESTVANVRRGLLLLLGAVGFVLLVVCANVANLLLVRGQGRLGEVAVRRALGASRSRILQQSLAESGLLAIAGAALGLALADRALPLFLELHGRGLPYEGAVGLDARVLAFTAALATATALAFGGLLAWQGMRHASAQQLRDGGRTLSGSRRRQRISHALVATEVALSFALVIGAGLMTRSFAKLLDSDPGFNPDGALVADFTLPRLAYPTPVEANALLRQLVEEVEALPGVVDVSHVTHLPMRGLRSQIDFELAGLPQPGPGQPAWNARVTAARANYFRVMGIPVLRGRAFDAALDRADTGPAVVVSRSLADRFLAGHEVVGQRMRLAGSTQPWWTIVGVVDDVRYEGLGEEATPTYYVLAEQTLSNALAGYESRGTLILRTAGVDPSTLAEPLRRVVATVDSELPLTAVEPLESLVERSVADSRFLMSLMGFFAAVALRLGALGIYGVTSYMVAQRTREIGIRGALGAERSRMALMVIRQGMRPVLLGVVLGGALALALGEVLSSLLYGVAAADGPTYLVTTAVFAVVGAAALWLPARRASSVDPVVALQQE